MRDVGQGAVNMYGLSPVKFELRCVPEAAWVPSWTDGLIVVILTLPIRGGTALVSLHAYVNVYVCGFVLTLQ